LVRTGKVPHALTGLAPSSPVSPAASRHSALVDTGQVVDPRDPTVDPILEVVQDYYNLIAIAPKNHDRRTFKVVSNLI
jgi:hypothetical protein